MDSNSTNSIVKPIIILSAPRAGSTLLFETLTRHPQLWSIGSESHALIEHVPQLSTVARGYVSNRLDESDATEEICQQLRLRFMNAAQNFKGVAYSPRFGPIRLLEKTPKNALRVAFLNQVFPDALFIHLVRDPRENISSIMQAWRSNRFMTYPNLPDWKGGWSLFLPDGWRNLIGKPLAHIARYQWQVANDAISNGLEKVELTRKMVMNYADLIADPLACLKQIESFAGLDHEFSQTMLANGLPLSRYTLTRPDKTKWYANAKDIAPQMDVLQGTLAKLNQQLRLFECTELDCYIDLQAVLTRLPKVPAEKLSKDFERVARNSPCPCGSGKKYRQCHGQLK